MTVGVASLVAVLGTALVPALGSTPAGAVGNTVTVVTGHSGTTAPSLGVPVPKASAQISPTYVAYNPSNGDTAVTQTKAGSVFVYLIAGGSGSESNEYMIQTAPNPSPAFGSLTSGDAYIVAGTGTAGLIAQPGNNQFGNSTTAVAMANPITPTSVAFDPSGNLLIAGESGTSSAIQVVAKTTGTFYGVAMTAGDLYTVADVGVSGAPASALNMGGVAAPANGMSVDSTGNIVVGDGSGVEFVNEQASGSLTLYGQSIPAQSAAVIAGNAEGGTDCAAGATSDSASSQYFQSAAPFVDSSDNVYFSDNEPGPASGCDWVLPAQTGTLDGLSVTAGNVYKLAGNGGTTATTDGTAGVSANVAGTSEMTLDSAGNVVLAVSGAATGTSPALQVLAESSATYYGVAMTAGDIYTVAGGPSHLLATLSGPTSLLNNGGGNLLFTDGAASSANLDEFSGAPTAVPVVSGVSPNTGAAAGGTSVTITSSVPNFTGATAVDFGTGHPGTGLTVVSPSEITVTSPAGTGTVNVTVTTPNGTSPVNAPSDQYTYNAAPTVTSVTPNNGPAGGTNTVTVAGSGFVSGSTSVVFGSNAGTSVNVTTSSSLTVVVPAGSGTVSVTVSTTGGGTSAPLANAYTYNAAPTVTAVSPNNGPAGGTNSVTVSGTGFTGASAVDFGTSNPGTSISSVTATSLTVIAPSGTGTVDVTVTTPNGTSAINAPSDQYTYNAAPTVTSVTPNNGPAGGTNTVTVGGSGFVSGSTSVVFGSNAGTSVNVTTSSSLTVVVPSGSGTVSVTVSTTGGGTSAPLANAYTYNAAPTVTAVTPNNGPAGGTNTVTVAGSGFVSGSTSVVFGANAGTSVNVTTSSSLTVVVPSGSGTVSVTVSTTGGGTSAPLANAYTYNGSVTPGGTVALAKTIDLIGNYPDKVSGTAWGSDTTVTLNQCATTTYSAATCDATNQVSVTLGTGRAAGIFKNALIDLAVGVIDTNGDTCGVAGSATCDVVVVGNTGDTTASGALTFTLPSFAVRKTIGVLGNYVDGLKATGFPIGDTIVAQECDGTVSVPTTVSTHCDATTQISGTAGDNGAVILTPTLRVDGAYADPAGGMCLVAGSCDIGVTDADNGAIGASVSVGFATQTMSLKETTNVLGNYVDPLKAGGFPIGDTVVAQECDSSVVIPSTVSSDCDSATQVSGTVGASGKVTFSSTGVTLRAGSAYTDTASGMCPFGGTCEVLVSDTTNPSVGLDEAVTFATPTASVKEATNVQPNYVDKVTAGELPVGDTVTAQECDANVTSANLGTNCDSATQITGTVGGNGKVTFTAAGVRVLVGSSYGTDGMDSAGGTCPAGGSCDIVINDSTSGAYVAVPIGLAL